MSNLFNDLAKNTTKKSIKKNDKPIIKIDGDDFDVNIKTFANLKKQMENIKTQMVFVMGTLKNVTMDKWFDLYKTNKSYPGSVIVTSDSDSSFMFSPSDKYINVNNERADELKEMYGNDIVTENIKFSFNSDLLDKYAQILSDFIQNSPDIDDNDRNNLIKAEKTINISKGSIEKAFTIGKGDIKTFIDNINPVFNIRTPKIND